MTTTTVYELKEQNKKWEIVTSPLERIRKIQEYIGIYYMCEQNDDAKSTLYKNLLSVNCLEFEYKPIDVLIPTESAEAKRERKETERIKHLEQAEKNNPCNMQVDAMIRKHLVKAGQKVEVEVEVVSSISATSTNMLLPTANMLLPTANMLLPTMRK